MIEIEETKALLHQLVKEHEQLIENKADFFEIKSLELEILKTEAQLRTLIDF